MKTEGSTACEQAIAETTALASDSGILAGRSKMRIGAIDYSIEEREEFRDDDGTKLNGLVQHTECAIVIEASMPEQAKYQTLWHEVLHAIAAQAGMDGNEAITHSLLDMFAYGISGALRDNPWLGKYPFGG